MNKNSYETFDLPESGCFLIIPEIIQIYGSCQIMTEQNGEVREVYSPPHSKSINSCQCCFHHDNKRPNSPV